ncbi:Hydroxylamine reductase [Candidatus Izimaplasma bacterium HR1]|jgi:hydroxylamine reductase|uniref:hydroxylamine reductase n=1 Tax=Candidatus Izimoplasma sp. HR1 TaxID=1541959 RepID=UPI0004F63E31|nr:Hydroxylamine reductase [Candidatus Izimaplasma bacterium HR1]
MERKMFCYQCQEAAKNTACEVMGVCGKTPLLSSYMDTFKYVLKGLAVVADEAMRNGQEILQADLFIMEGLFKLITNANFDDDVFKSSISEGIALRESLKRDLDTMFDTDITTWASELASEFVLKAGSVGVMSTIDEDIRSIREIIITGLMGLTAYHSHAHKLGYIDLEIFNFTRKALIALQDNSLTLTDYIGLVDETGKYGVIGMALLDKANTTTYGVPKISHVNIGVGKRPGILISGHDLHDIKELLEQSKDAGIDIYTHSEMLPAHYYPELQQYSHLYGNYGSAWYNQKSEFTSFNGPILFTTNCIVPPKGDTIYKNKVFTTGNTGHPDFKFIVESNGKKDFSEIIELAKSSKAPIEIESGTIVGGFGHNQVLELADTVIENIKNGSIKKFVVMAGCDGRSPKRSYYTEFARELPKDTIILTAGCAKFKYNKLNLGDINGIPRVLDAGQCNDSYSLAVIALTLADVFKCDINDLPIAYNIAWYEQKAVIVLLALLNLGVKNIKLGPTLPAFLSENVANFLIDTFNLSTISTVEQDIREMI